MKIYTRTGDSGETSLFDGTRVSKSDPRVEAYGDVDELNAVIGGALASGVSDPVRDMLLDVQRDLLALGARLADPNARVADRITRAALTKEDAGRLETWIDRLEADLPPLRRFILPGGSPAGAALQHARTVCRRAERRMVTLAELDPDLIVYINRLSDFLFVAARAVNHAAGVPEVEWS